MEVSNCLCFCVIVLIFARASGAYGAISKNTTTNQATNGAIGVKTTKAPATVVATTTRKPLLQGFRMPCSCVDGQCGCCTGTVLDQFRQKACLNVTYEPDDFAITAAMSMNNRVLFKRTVSGKNPPPVCVNVPRIPFIRFCVQFSNIYFASRNVHLCIDAEANWAELTLLEWSFDCIRMGASGVAVVGPEEGGGVPANPIDAVDQTDEDYDDSARDALYRPPVSPSRATHRIIFDSSVKAAAGETPDKSRIRVDRLSNGDFRISYLKNKLSKRCTFQ